MKPSLHDVSINGILKSSSARRWHSPDCYISNEYSKTLASNPFVRGLVRTHHEPCFTRLPNGSLVPVVPRKTDSGYALEFTDKVYVSSITASSYILWNQRVMATVEFRKMWHRYISLKFKTKNGDRVVHNTKPIPNISDEYKEKLVSRILGRLSSLKLVGKDGIQLVSNGELIDISDKLKICLPSIERDVFIPYEDNEDLCYDILRLMRYYL